MKLSIFILLILSLIPSFSFSSEKNKTFYLICEGKSIYEIDDRNVKESKTYELRWLSSYYKIFHDNSYTARCTNSKKQFDCRKVSYDGFDNKTTYSVTIDRINGAIEQLYINDVPNNKWQRQLNHVFKGFCKIKNKTLF